VRSTRVSVRNSHLLCAFAALREIYLTSHNAELTQRRKDAKEDGELQDVFSLPLLRLARQRIHLHHIVGNQWNIAPGHRI